MIFFRAVASGLLLTFGTTQFGGFFLNVAVTDFAPAIVNEQVPVPVQAPLQPANDEPLPAAALRINAAPLSKSAEQVAPQLIPDGALVTVPVPDPALVTVSRNSCATAVTDSVTRGAAL